MADENAERRTVEGAWPKWQKWVLLGLFAVIVLARMKCTAWWYVLLFGGC